jgi:hypothetical protein
MTTGVYVMSLRDFNAACFAFNTRSHYRASTSLRTELKGALQINTTLIYLYLPQQYEEQKNK